MGKSLAERFQDKFEPEPMSGCWIWSAALTADGYGRFYVPFVVVVSRLVPVDAAIRWAFCTSHGFGRFFAMRT